MVGEVNLHKEELASKPARLLFSHYLVEQLISLRIINFGQILVLQAMCL